MVGICVLWRRLEIGLGSGDICEPIEQEDLGICQEESWSSWAVLAQLRFWHPEGTPLPPPENPSGIQEEATGGIQDELGKDSRDTAVEAGLKSQQEADPAGVP